MVIGVGERPVYLDAIAERRSGWAMVRCKRGIEHDVGVGSAVEGEGEDEGRRREEERVVVRS